MRTFFTCLLFCISISAFAADYNILTYGAKADGTTVNTKAIQQAIDKCSEAGGRVNVPAGTFMTGTLYLKSNVTLYLMNGAQLKGSAAMKNYPDNIVGPRKNVFRSLIVALNVNAIAIAGQGTIDGNGASPEFNLGDNTTPGYTGIRPSLIYMYNCKGIDIFDVHLKNSGFWMENYQHCEGLHIKGVQIFNHANFNNDAIDIDCKNALVEDCTIDSDDDGICLKSEDKTAPCENVTIRNCIVASNCNAIKFGTTSRGGFRNINISNITIHQASEDKLRNWQKQLKFIEQPITVLAGIAIENVDGGFTDNVTINNIFMNDVQTPIFIKMGNRAAPKDKTVAYDPGHLHNVSISNVTAVSHSKITSSITGFPGYDVENVQLSNIRISTMGNGTADEADAQLPENETLYPENRMFGQVLPSSGLFIRHVKGLSLQNITLQTRNMDARPHIIMEDVKDTQIGQLTTEQTEITNAAIKLVNCDGVTWANPTITKAPFPVLTVEGDKSKSINVVGMTGGKDKVQIATSVPKGAVNVN